MTPAAHEDAPLWPDRYLTEGRIVIARSSRAAPRQASAPAWEPFRDSVVGLDWLAWIGREWSRQSTGAQWALAVLIVAFTAGFGLVVPVAGVLLYRYRLDNPREHGSPLPLAPAPLSPEEILASWDTIEARVAAAASRAWAETIREPAWHSPLLAQSRAAFDGQVEVDQIIDLALRIRNARLSLGMRPTGPTAEYWERQFQALEITARQLGRRADALIRHRDQAAMLTMELQNLMALERLERSAAEIDGLTIETAYATGPSGESMAKVAEEIAGVRHAMTELVDLMTRTRAPLLDPPTPPPGAPY